MVPPHSSHQQETDRSPFAANAGRLSEQPVLATSTAKPSPSNADRLSGRELDALEKAGGAELDSDGFRRRSLRIAIVTENFLPKVDGVTRTLAMLLEHLQKEGHDALVLGPDSGMTSYAGHEVVGTKGVPLLGVYKGLALNFIRPRFIRKLREFQPDVIQFVDPIWLCAQVIPVVQYYMPDTPLLTSYHTNLAMYATLFGFSWLTPTMWSLQRNLHGRCKLTYCPSPSTARMLESQGFNNVRLWPRGVNTKLFRPEARDYALRQSWSAEPESNRLSSSSSDSISAFVSRRSSLDSNPPPYVSTTNGQPASSRSKVVMLYVGRISWEKNLRLLVEAFRGLEKPSEDGSRPACQLVFVGDGPSRPELESLCTQYGLGAVFMGYRKGEELAAAYASADIFAFPSWTETFGQVVLESLASGLPVVGLRAEGVCDLVKHEETGLLLDLDDLLPTSERPSSPSDPTTFKPLPMNPHRLVNVSSPTFPLAVSMYRELLVRLASDHARRHLMGQAAHTDASTNSWHGAMEMLVDGYREIARPIKTQDEEIQDEKNLALSRTSTIDLDIVCGDGAQVDQSSDESKTSSRPNKKTLRFGRVFRRTGGRAKEGSMNAPMISSWLGRSEKKQKQISSANSVGVVGSSSPTMMVATKERSGSIHATRWILKVVLLSYVAFAASQWVLNIESVRRIIT